MDNTEQIKEIIEKSLARKAELNDKYQKAVSALTKEKEKISGLIDKQLALQLKWAYLESDLNNTYHKSQEEDLNRQIVVVKDSVEALEDEIYNLTTVLLTGYDSVDI